MARIIFLAIFHNMNHEHDYKAYLNQGGGCDYTIGCGKTVIDLNARSMEEAVKELEEIIHKDYSHEERLLDSAVIYEISSQKTFDMTVINKRIEDEFIEKIKKEKEIKERQEFERLKTKFG